MKIENLKLSFHGPQGRVPAVRGVDLEVRRGETLALVGESGCGKTALCRCILMLHSQHAIIEEGQINLCGNDVTRLSEKELEKVRGRDAAMIFQDPMSSLNPTFSIGTQIMEPILIHEKVTKAEAKARALSLLELVGIDNPQARFKQYPHHFSGGMRQRVAIAIALACNPKLIIADEPTTSLDTTTQNKIMELLKNLCRDDTKSVIFVTHDLGLAEDVADRIAVMKDGRIVEMGETKELFADPQHPYTQKLLGFARYGKGTSHYHGRIKAAMEKVAADTETMVEVKNLSKSFRLGRKTASTALRTFDMTINKGEIVGIVGDSGCGKSTLARCMMGIYEPSGGEITWAEGCRKQMIFQDSASAFNPRMTLEQIIAEPLVIRGGCNKAQLQDKVYDLMDQVGLERDLAQRHPYDVSGGQRQRAAIARALITEPDFIIADEPISSLDVSIQSQIIHLLKKIHDERNLTMMLIAHDLPMVEHVSDRIIKIEKQVDQSLG